MGSQAFSQKFVVVVRLIVGRCEMKNKSSLIHKQWLAVGFVLVIAVSSVRAEYESEYKAQYTPSNLSTLEGFSKSLGGSGSVASEKSFDEMTPEEREAFFAQIAEEDALKQARSEEEIAVRGKVDKWSSTIAKKKAAIKVPGQVESELFATKKSVNKATEGLVSSIRRNEGGGLESLNTQDLEKSCRRKLNLEETVGLAKKLSGSKMTELRADLSQIVADEKQQIKDAEKVALVKRIADLKNEISGGTDEEISQDKIDRIAQAPNQDQRIEDLKKVGKAQKETITDLNLKLVDSITKMVGTFSEFKGSEEEFARIKSEQVDSMDSLKSKFVNSATQQAGQIHLNCEKIRETSGMDNALQPGSVFKKAYDAVVGFHFGDPTYANSVLLPGLQALGNKLQCANVAPQINAVSTSELNSAIDEMAVATSPATLAKAAVRAMDTMQNLEIAMVQPLQSALDACEVAAKESKKAEKFAQQFANASQQQQGQIPQGTFGSSTVTGVNSQQSFGAPQSTVNGIHNPLTQGIRR